jgi:AcrR family transcriptional regulator
MTKVISEARMRLQQAALDLFREHGYDRTTAAEIAARAGVTERTFFRHFPDKREVLFDGQAVLLEALMTSIGDAPAELGPLDTLFRAFRSATELLENNRPFSKPRQEVISTTPALHERELSKLEALSDALAQALEARGTSRLQARLAAQAGMAAFADATLLWLDHDEPGLAAWLDRSEEALKSIVYQPRPSNVTSDRPDVV